MWQGALAKFMKNKPVTVGGDLIAALSVGLYKNPLEVYRELIQNATDAYQEKQTPKGERRIDITIDRTKRTASVRDYATGLSMDGMAETLLSLGNSKKSGQNLRGFRGIGRLSPLGHCKKLIFRTRQSATSKVQELTWDGIAFHRFLSNPSGHDISDILQEITTYAEIEPWDDCPECFFECVMESVKPSTNDVLLNEEAVAQYLSEVAPVSFSKEFSFAREIYGLLGDELTYEVEIFINNSEAPITRPHADQIYDSKGNPLTKIYDLKEMEELNNDFASIAKGWILHHDYLGALPINSNLRGLRIRVGNIQIGDGRILEHLFPETRFNGWCIGEIHINTPNIRPNTRRDNLEPSNELDDLENILSPLARKLAQICRDKSSERNQKAKPTSRTVSLKAKEFNHILSELDIEEPFPDRVVISLAKKMGD